MTGRARGGSLAGLLLLALGACAANQASRLDDGTPARSARPRRPPGMPIGTGAAGGTLEPGDGAPVTVAALDTPPAEVTAGLVEPASPSTPATATRAPAIPCTGCIELQVDVDDINQRDEFAFMTDGSPITRVVWTLRVNFNSDQLAVQPFVDGERGKYTALHVNTFPLGQPVEVAQDFKGKGRAVGLVVGSSGAWTGNQTMSVFIDSVSVEGPHGSTRSFATDAEGVAPCTSAHNPKIALHPDSQAARAEPPK